MIYSTCSNCKVQPAQPLHAWCTECLFPDIAKAARYNEGKIDLTLIPIDAQEQEAMVWMIGAKKYSRDNWAKLWGNDTINTVLASLLRHAAQLQKGEYRDVESGLLHAASIRCNAAMLIRYCLQQEALDGKSKEDKT